MTEKRDYRALLWPAHLQGLGVGLVLGAGLTLLHEWMLPVLTLVALVAVTAGFIMEKVVQVRIYDD